MKGTNNQPDEPKTPHEEVMFVVESTNDIVSKMLSIMEKCCPVCVYEEDCREKE